MRFIYRMRAPSSGVLGRATPGTGFTVMSSHDTVGMGNLGQKFVFVQK
jgi:hypothetical protein